MADINIRNKIVMIDREKLKDYDKNNKNHPQEQIDLLVQNIKKFGFTTPILIDKKKEIIAGHGRKLAADKLMLDKVPCIIIDDLSESEIRALRIADNRLNEMSETNWDNLWEEYQFLKGTDTNLEFLTGLTTDDFLVPIEEKKAEEMEIADDDYTPSDEKYIETDIKYGDVIQLGKHRLMCGDSTILTDVKTLTDKKEMDMLLTDPPYNVDYTGGTGLKIINDKMEDGKFLNFLVDLFRSADSVLKKGGVFYIWHADSEGFNFRGACKEVGWQVRQCLIWNKNAFVMGRQDYQWKHEPCLYGWKDGAGHFWDGGYRQSTVIDESDEEIDLNKLNKKELYTLAEELLEQQKEIKTTILNENKPHANKEHPTMKPIPLFARQILNNTKRGESVLDLCGGSGTTMIAGEQTDRTTYIMELDPKYCEVICRRFEKFTGEQRRVLDGNSED